MTYMKDPKMEEALSMACGAANSHGKDPIKVIEDYLFSYDCYCIPSSEARNKMKKCDRDEIMKELLRSYLESDAILTKKETLQKDLQYIYDAEKEKGYNPYYQISNYLLTGDPSYITAPARPKAEEYDRYDILEELLHDYLKL